LGSNAPPEPGQRKERTSLSIYLSVCLYLYLTFYLSIYLSICLYLYLSIYLYLYLGLTLRSGGEAGSPMVVFLRRPVNTGGGVGGGKQVPDGRGVWEVTPPLNPGSEKNELVYLSIYLSVYIYI